MENCIQLKVRLRWSNLKNCLVLSWQETMSVSLRKTTPWRGLDGAMVWMTPRLIKAAQKILSPSMSMMSMRGYSALRVKARWKSLMPSFWKAMSLLKQRLNTIELLLTCSMPLYLARFSSCPKQTRPSFKIAYMGCSSAWQGWKTRHLAILVLSIWNTFLMFLAWVYSCSLPQSACSAWLWRKSAHRLVKICWNSADLLSRSLSRWLLLLLGGREATLVLSCLKGHLPMANLLHLSKNLHGCSLMGLSNFLPAEGSLGAPCECLKKHLPSASLLHLAPNLHYTSLFGCEKEGLGKEDQDWSLWTWLNLHSPFLKFLQFSPNLQTWFFMTLSIILKESN